MKKQLKFVPLIVLIAFLCSFVLTTPSYAEKGDFYEKNKEKIEAAIPKENKKARQFIESYDYDTNSFDCGMTDFSCSFKSVIFEPIIGTVQMTYDGLKSTVVKPSYITGNETFVKFKNGFKSLSTTLLAIFLMWQTMKAIAVRFADGSESLNAINQKLVTVISLGILLGIYDKFFDYILTIQEILVKAVIEDPISMYEVVLMILLYGVGYGIFIILILAGVLLIFSVTFMYRFVLFGLLYMVGVLAIPTGVNEEYNYFSLWLRILMNNIVTLFLQALCFSVGFVTLIKNDTFGINTSLAQNAFGYGVGISFVISLAFFVLALSIPGLLGQLGSSTGTTRAMGSMARYVAMRR